jgi:hypothetical protein
MNAAQAEFSFFILRGSSSVLFYPTAMLAHWQLHQHTASLADARFQAALRWSRPSDGLVDVKMADTPLTECRFLGIDIPPTESTAVPTSSDCYVRGAEIVVAYRATTGWPVQTDAVWRALTPTTSNGWIAAIELIVSVRTALLDSRPALSVQNSLAVQETWRLVDPAGPHFEAVGLSQSRPPLAWENGPGCLLFRLRPSDLSYVEMVHPADFCHDALANEPEQPFRVRATHCLFSNALEKGVILRGRVRGIFLPRGNDMAVAAAAYAQFAAEDPPLGTY